MLKTYTVKGAHLRNRLIASFALVKSEKVESFWGEMHLFGQFLHGFVGHLHAFMYFAT